MAIWPSLLSLPTSRTHDALSPPVRKPWPHVQTGRDEPSGALERRLQARTPDVQPFNSGRHLLSGDPGIQNWTDLILEFTSQQSRSQRMQLRLWSIGAHPALGVWKCLKIWKARMLCLNAVYLGGEENNPIFVIKKRKLEMCWCL